MKHLLSIVCLLVSLSVAAQVQQPNGQWPNARQQRQGWNQRQNPNGNPNQGPNRVGQFSPAEYAQQQREFFTKNAELTQAEADAFFPIYNELQQF